MEDYLQSVDPGAAFNPNMSHDVWNEVWNKVIDAGGVQFLQEPAGINIAEFLAGDGVYKGVQLHGKGPQKLKEWLSKYVVAVMSRLAKRFPQDSMDVFAALEILNPVAMPDDPALHRYYGIAELEVLSDWYGKARPAGGTTHPPLVDPVELQIEWKPELFKETLKAHKDAAKLYISSKQKAGRSRDDIIAELLTTSNAVAPNIRTLLEIRAVRPSNTSMCECGFSEMKMIKTALRNRLYIETLDALMLIKLVGKRYVDWVAKASLRMHLNCGSNPICATLTTESEVRQQECSRQKARQGSEN